MAKLPRTHGLNEPLRHEFHKRPVTRRDFLAQGFRAGLGTVMGTSLLGMLAQSPAAIAQSVSLSGDIEDLKNNLCGLATQGAGKIPFLCFDFAGGAGIVKPHIE